MIDFHAGMNEAIITDGYVIADISIRKYFCVPANLYIFADISECADKNIISKFC